MRNIKGKLEARDQIIVFTLSFILGGCGVLIHEKEEVTESFTDGYVEGYYEGKYDEAPMELHTAVTTSAVQNDNNSTVDERKQNESEMRTWQQINANGDVTIVNVYPGKESKQVKKVKGKEKVVSTYYPKGVRVECYGQEPFRDHKYFLQSYLTDIQTPEYLHLLLSTSNLDETIVIGDDAASLENTLSKATLRFTVSRIDYVEEKKVLKAIQTYRVNHPVAVDIERMENAQYSFKVLFNPIFLDEKVYKSGNYTITDIWLTYRAGENRYRKISGGCPKYNFSIEEDEYSMLDTDYETSTTTGIEKPGEEISGDLVEESNGNNGFSEGQEEESLPSGEEASEI